MGWWTFAIPPVRRPRRGDHRFDLNVGFKELRPRVTLSGKELA